MAEWLYLDTTMRVVYASPGAESPGTGEAWAPGGNAEVTPVTKGGEVEGYLVRLEDARRIGAKLMGAMTSAAAMAVALVIVS